MRCSRIFIFFTDTSFGRDCQSSKSGYVIFAIIFLIQDEQATEKAMKSKTYGLHLAIFHFKIRLIMADDMCSTTLEKTVHLDYIKLTRKLEIYMLF